jgi:hypothetical protein
VSAQRHPRKRAAFEPLAAPEALNPRMRRPAATVAGGVLVLLRAISGAVWGASIVFGLPSWLRAVAGFANGDNTIPTDDTIDDLGLSTEVFIGLIAVVFLIQVVFGILLLLGSNAARVIVMIVSTISISAAFVGWWEVGDEITVGTTLVTLALDILVLLALSSRDAAAYARRNERRH